MADYTSTVELVLNGLEKLNNAEKKIKDLDGKKVNIKFDVDSNAIKNIQESISKGVSTGVVGGVTQGAQSGSKAVREQAVQQQKESQRIAKEQEKQEARAKKLAWNREQRAIADNALKIQNMYRNAARGYIGKSESTRENLNAKGDSYDKPINKYLGNDKVPQAQRDSFQRRVEFANESHATRDAIKEEGVAYKETSTQADLYTKQLKGLYASYAKLRGQAIRANVGSTEQRLLNNEALIRKGEYESLRSDVESTLTSSQIAQLDYMEQKSDLGLRDAAVTRQASIDSQVTNLNYRNILDSQRRINSLELDRSKISQNESDLYNKYTDAITRAKTEQEGMIASYGRMDDYQKAQLDNLKQEGVYRKENYDLLHQVSTLDKDISRDYFEARLNANSKMKGIYKSDIEEVRGLYANAQNETDMQYASKREQALFARAAAQGNNGLSLIDKFKNGISSFTTMLVGPMALFRYGVTAAKAVMSNVTQMDAAMTELYKVTYNSQHEYDKFRTATEKTSAEIGATQVALVQSTATFARLGYNLSDSAELGKNAALFSNVGDEGMTSTEAAEDMVAIMKGFNIQAEDSIHIVDALNQVGNRFSISSTGLGESLKRSGGAMATANNTLEETIGLTVAANDAMQDPASTGTALRTIALRLRGRHTCPSRSNTCPLTQYKLVA